MWIDAEIIIGILKPANLFWTILSQMCKIYRRILDLSHKISRRQETVKTVGNIPDRVWSAEESGKIKLSAELGTSDTSELSVKWGDQLSITQYFRA